MKHSLIRRLALLLALLLPLCAAGAAYADGENMLLNPDFEQLGSDGHPANWSLDMYDYTEGVTFFVEGDEAYTGDHSAGIISLGDNDARYLQTVACQPDTLYRLSGYVHVHDVDGGNYGANLSILNTFTASNTVLGSSEGGDWTYLEVYGLTGPDQYSMDVCARLGFYSSTVTGEAYFDGLELVQVDDVPDGAVFGLFYREATPVAETVETETEPNDTDHTALILFYALCFALIAGVLIYKRRSGPLQGQLKLDERHYNRALIALLGCALLIRLVLAASISGYPNDIACWQGWGGRMASYGPWHFYTDGGFCDYPPAYMYVLWLVESIRSLFGVASNSGLALILVKLPAILCDLIGAMLIARWARRDKADALTALLLTALYALNPAAIADSAAWGQIDSVFSLLMVVAIHLCIAEKWTIAIPVYVVSVLLKPQTLMVAPVAATVLIVDIIRAGDKRTALLKQIGIALAISAGVAALIVIPFWGGQSWNWLILKYTDTLGSYNYAAVNALNLYSLLGKNWVDASQTLLGLPMSVWGYVAMAVAIAYSAFMYCRAKDRRVMPLCCALLILILFSFSTKMHERYAFPAILLLLYSYVLLHDWRLLVATALLTLTQFVNIALVLQNMHLQSSQALINDIFALIGILNTLLVCWTAWDICVRDKVRRFSDEAKAGAHRRLFGKVKTETAAADADEGAQTADAPKHSGSIKSDENRKLSYPWLLGIVVAAMLGVGLGALTGRLALMCLMCVGAYLFMLIIRFKLLPRPSDADMIERITGRSNYRLNMKPVDYAIVGAITVIYAVIAFVGLGTLNAPQTEWMSSQSGETVTFDLGETRTFNMTYYGGICNSAFTVEFSDDGENWTAPIQAEYREGKIFQWLWLRETVKNDDGTFTSLVNGYPTQTARYVRLTFESAGFKMREVGFLDADGNPYPIASVTSDGFYPTLYDDPNKMIDEQDTVPAQPSYYNSMYFDEIYHARTAYEHLHNIHTYEWTHPPLGKVLMMIGIAIFGMCPFGWRFMGTLMGVIMVPIMYLLTRQLFKRRDLSIFTTVLMTFDAMHLTQTRLATIDSYGVLFIMIMYLFMFRYMQMSFNRDKLWRTFIPLGLSGIFFGIGCASKWIDIYAGFGLAILFFATVAERYNEYRFARRYCAAKGERSAEVAVAGDTFIKNLLITGGFCVVFFIIVPLLIYYLSYYWQLKPDGGLSIDGVITLQRSMFNYHAGLSGDTHPFRASWWQWPLITKPMYYYSGRDFVPDGTYSIIWCMGNPAVWWTMLVGMAFTIVACACEKFRDKQKLIIIVSFAAQFLPWVLVPRSTFIYHYFASIPFMIISLCFVLKYIEKLSRKAAYITGGVLMAAAVALFIILYPVMTGAPMSAEHLSFINALGPWHLY